jgi:hypothetical protein
MHIQKQVISQQEEIERKKELTSGELKVRSLDDGVYGTGLLAETAVDTLGHVDIVSSCMTYMSMTK